MSARAVSQSRGFRVPGRRTRWLVSVEPMQTQAGAVISSPEATNTSAEQVLPGLKFANSPAGVVFSRGGEHAGTGGGFLSLRELRIHRSRLLGLGHEFDELLGKSESQNERDVRFLAE